MEKSEYFRTAVELLRELGISTPDEIDIEAIAFHCGATVRYRPLTGCAARILGNGDKAIITVDSNSIRARQRFSAAHELGHWMHDRGKASFSCQEAQFIREWSASNPESRANGYASDLLLPVPIFKPKAQAFRTIDFDTVRHLAEMFSTSLTATAIRLVEHGPLPAVLVCYTDGTRAWFVRGELPEQLWPRDKPEPNTYAADLLINGGTERELRGDVSVARWFDHPIAGKYYLQEHSIRSSYGDVLSLLWWKDEQMLVDLNDYEERRAARRSDRQWDE